MLNKTERLEQEIIAEFIKKLVSVESAPFTIQIGYTIEDFCKHNGFVVKNSSHAVIERIRQIANTLYERNDVSAMLITMDAHNQGLLITVSCYEQK